MHVHLFTDDEFPDALAEDEFKIMVAYGVTTIRLMTGTPEQLVLRARSARGEILAPTIYAASPQFIGKKSSNAYLVTTAGEARDEQYPAEPTLPRQPSQDSLLCRQHPCRARGGEGGSR